jgi:methylated-DNA-[protein]-cysteine S-methyltransferase
MDFNPGGYIDLGLCRSNMWAVKRFRRLDGKMSRRLRYVIFRTRWGWFGLLGGERGLLRTSLPVADRDKAKSVLLKGIRAARRDGRLFSELQEKIRVYFEGDCVDFTDARVELDGFSGFSRKVLIACRGVGYGRRVSYGELAELAGQRGAGRAVGNVLSRNRVPLIIPCHRVTRSDGKLGGFSAGGGISLKKKMLELEASML